MSRQQFQCILLKIRSDIQPRFNLFRNDTISAKEKLCLTLRFLATGASFADLSFRILMGKTTVRWCIMQTIQKINKHFTDLVMPVPESPSFWKEVSLDFLSNWNFPNCLGAVDGKHVKMFAPRKSSSFNFNYKKCFSTVLMAVVDANYKFIMVSIGAHGSKADSTVFSSSNFGKAWLSNPKSLFVPADQKLPSTENFLPFVLVGDKAFGLRYNLMTPFPGSHLTTKQRVFNYRLSRARRIVESTFGILVHTWRVLIKPLEIQMDLAKPLILCCCVLHNFLQNAKDHLNPSHFQDEFSAQLVDQEARNAQPASMVVNIRNAFSDWLVTEGNLDYQWERIII